MNLTNIHQHSYLRLTGLGNARWLMMLGLLMILSIPLFLSGCTIVSIEELEAAEQRAEFDPARFVDGVWESQVLPEVLEKAVDASTVLAAIESDLEKGGETHGFFVGGSYNFVVQGQGKITAVDTESRNGTMTVALDGYSGPATVILQIGPSIRGDALRDAGGIEFGQFKDQTEFGKVSRELNKRIVQDVVGELDTAGLIGKTASFQGVFAISTTNQTNIDLSTFTLTPVELQIQ